MALSQQPINPIGKQVLCKAANMELKKANFESDLSEKTVVIVI
jgi:hypothetical protein